MVSIYTEHHKTNKSYSAAFGKVTGEAGTGPAPAEQAGCKEGWLLPLWGNVEALISSVNLPD